MTKITINLLPAEFTRQREKDDKFYKFQALGVGMILILIFLSSLTISLQMLQNQRLKQAQERLDNASEKVESFQSKQVALMALKNRLGAINQYMGVPSIQSELLNLVNKLIPSSATISNLVVDRSGEVALALAVSDDATLDNIMSDLLDKDKNKGKINKISVEGLSRGRDGVYKLNIKIKPK